MKFPIPLDALDAFSINFFETNGVRYNRVEIFPSLIFFYLSSINWGELGHFLLKRKDQAVTELIVDHTNVYGSDLVSVFNKLPENVRCNLRKSPDFPSRLLTKNSKHEWASILALNSEEFNKELRFSIFITNFLSEQRNLIFDEIYNKYQAQLRVHFDISEPIIPALPTKRRGGPIPTPDEEKDKMIDDWEKVRGTMTIQVFCHKKHIGESTFRLWRSERKNKNRPPLT